MSQQALYRKWRSSSFDELVGQPHVVRTLTNALQSDRVAHAYIFSGPRGTGKTSSARILAKTINCTAAPEARPCNDCHLCRSISNGTSLDLIEIDAASNTQVDKVREAIVEKVNFVPSEARKKVYIIDEVHMLSNSAFNALLKTIEEPPPHAMFILATTELHKVPETILSRCQRLDFRRIPVSEIADHLAFILSQEGIEAEPELLALVARQATGSMRDAQSLLDQLMAHGGDRLTVADARAALGLASLEAVQQLVALILAQDIGAALLLVNDLLDQGTDPRQFLADLLDHLRALLLTLAGNSSQLHDLPEEAIRQLEAQRGQIKPRALIEIIRRFTQAGSELKLALQPQLPLELAIVEAVLALQGQGDETVLSAMPTAAPRPDPAAGRPLSALREPRNDYAPAPPASQAPTAPDTGESPQHPPTHEAEPRAATPPPAPTVPHAAHSLAWWQAEWEAVLARLDDMGETGQRAALRLKFGHPHEVDGAKLVIGFPFSIHKEKLEAPADRQAMLRALRAVGGETLEAELRLVPRTAPASSPPKTKFELAADDPVVQEALRHGGHIVDVYQS
ncbi:MAG: DNA polymerase III subunit gamma/tau [Anaerolineales bacterium]|nr:DNA polymerase III subunit gamma/tau [Anaerolineales bacterium]MCB9128822.1 DNA polymerase III subunit gamma/tau [Ardenticatenales bacterium]MCB9171386.1 DNA polymerase III subunit gamma/tau [Ardenticatenales bacterium]